ncbi:MAG: hypothetical protein ACOYOV_07575 [Bacteroidales bacterium]
MENICVKIGSKKHYFEFPSGWDDINSSDLTAIYKYINGEIEEAGLIADLIKGDMKHFAKIPGDYFAEAFVPLLKFMEKEPPERWYFDRIESKDIIVCGPVNYGRILTGEFAFADTYFKNYQETMDESFLDKCIVSLMRAHDLNSDDTSQNWNGDYRIKFNENMIEFNAKRIALLPVQVKQAFVWNYNIFRNYLERSFIWVFQKGGNDSKNTGWEKIIGSMCKGDLTKLDDMTNIPLLTFMSELNDSIKDNSK